jgi:SOS-response transcriptional repressor LexA
MRNDLQNALIGWLKAGLSKPNKSKSGLAKELGRAASSVSMILNGKREIKAREIPIIADYIDELPPYDVSVEINDGIITNYEIDVLDNLSRFDAEASENHLNQPHPANLGLPIRGDVAAGLWHEIDAFADPGEFERAPVVVSPNFPAEAQYALRVVGTSINRIAQEGDFLRCVDIWIAGLTPRDGDLAIVEQRRNGEQLREVTAKRIRQTNGILRLEPESTDPKWQPILLDPKKAPDGIEARIIAIVDLVFRPVTRL